MHALVFIDAEGLRGANIHCGRTRLKTCYLLSYIVHFMSSGLSNKLLVFICTPQINEPFKTAPLNSKRTKHKNPQKHAYT